MLFVGGTALYLKALLRGLFDGPGSDPELRRRLEEEAEALGDAALHARLAALDPTTAARLHPERPAAGRPGPGGHRDDRPAAERAPGRAPASRRRPRSRSMRLEPPRDRLYERIDRRVLAFFDAGLVEEVRSLLGGERPMSPVAAQAIGYREVIAMLAGRATLAETIERIQARSRQFAKRQGTWFRGLEEVRAFPVEPDEDAEAIAERLGRRLD